MFRLVQLALLFSSAVAFTANKPSFKSPLTTRQLIMSEHETEAVIQHASECMEGECSVDEVADLIALLKGTERDLESRLENIMNMVGHLQHINKEEERKTDEVRDFVKDMLRVFNTDKPGFMPMGFTGDIGDGPKTAYDVLPPKKWTNPEKL